MCLNQGKYNEIKESVLNKNWLTLIFWSQCYLKWSGGYVSYDQIYDCGEENESSIQYSNHNYQVDFKKFRNCTWICAHVNDLSLVGVVWPI